MICVKLTHFIQLKEVTLLTADLTQLLWDCITSTGSVSSNREALNNQRGASLEAKHCL